jgi:hypothetical protein
MSTDRSPRFPVIGLPEAVKHVENLFDGEGRSVVAAKVAVTRFGYTTLNGNSTKVLGAMRKYGLVEDAPNGVKVSPDGIVIAAHKKNPFHPDRTAAVRRAADRVELFGTIQKDFGVSPSEPNLIAQLIGRGFTPDGASRAARSYRATMALVGAPNADYPSGQEAQSAGVEEDISKPSGGASAARRGALPRAREYPQRQHAAPFAQTTEQDGGVLLLEGERVVFTEEGGPGQYLKVIASGDIDDTPLEALEDFVRRQRKRLEVSQNTRRHNSQGNQDA